MCLDKLKFLSRQLKICPDSPKCVRTLQDVSGQFKICPDSSTCVRTVQNMVGRERWLRTFLVCRERDLRVFRPEDFWVPPGRYKVFRPLVDGHHHIASQLWPYSSGNLAGDTLRPRNVQTTRYNQVFMSCMHCNRLRRMLYETIGKILATITGRF